MATNAGQVQAKRERAGWGQEQSKVTQILNHDANMGGKFKEFASVQGMPIDTRPTMV